MKLVYGDDPFEIVPGDLVAVDTETTGLEWMDDLIGVSMAWEREGQVHNCYMSMDNNEPGTVVSPRLIHRIFSCNDLVFHNLAFDYRALYKAFKVPAPRTANDTMTLAKSIDWQEELSLEALYTRYIGIPPEWWSRVKKMRSRLKELGSETWRYAAFDAVATLLVFNKLKQLVRGGKTGLIASLYQRDYQFTQLVCKLMARGVPLDFEDAANRKKRFLEGMEVTKLALQTSTGIENPMSTQQVGAFMERTFPAKKLGKTKTGRVTTSEEALEAFSDHPAVQRIIEYRQLDKAISSWIDPLVAMAELDGNVHAILSPFGTRSFRMSSSKLNMQGIPIDEKDTAFGTRAYGGFKGIFKSRIPGELLYAIDIKQAEFRLAAMLAHENRIAEMFSGGGDPYVNMAIAAYHDEKRRQDAKRAALASLYETGARTFARNNKLTEQEARSILTGFRNSFPAIKEASRYYESFATDNGYVQLMDGRRRYFGPGDELYKAFNQRVQGSVSEAMQVAMLEIENMYPGRMVLQIHDSIVLHLPEDERAREKLVQPIREVIRASIPDKVYAMTTPQIPYIAETKIWQ